MAPYQQALQQPSQPITPYQQAVQPPRPVGRGGATQSASGAAIPTAGQPVQERRRQLTRGRGLLGRGRLASRSRRGRRLTAGAPATNTQGDAQPQPGCRTRTSGYDPAILAGNYRSSGWQKDLEHVLKVYYRYNLQAPFDELEWIRVRELFFDRFAAKRAEALRIKEESPLDYMPFIAGEFYAVTGIHLHELQDFTRWIKKNSYYHGLLVHQGQIEEIPHLIGEGFPKWPQLKPSESHRNSYSRAEGLMAGSSEPATRPPAAPTQETPAEEPPMVEAPVPGPSHSSPPAPMETGGAGDGQSWADQAEASAEAEFRQVRPPKHPRPNQGDGGWVQRYPSPSKIRRVGTPR